MRRDAIALVFLLKTSKLRKELILGKGHANQRYVHKARPQINSQVKKTSFTNLDDENEEIRK